MMMDLLQPELGAESLGQTSLDKEPTHAYTQSNSRKRQLQRHWHPWQRDDCLQVQTRAGRKWESFRVQSIIFQHPRLGSICQHAMWRRAWCDVGRNGRTYWLTGRQDWTNASRTVFDEATIPWHQAMGEPQAEGYWQVCKLELKTQTKMSAWDIVERKDWINVLPRTWTVKCKW
jgi:hypothetical protein